MEKAAKKQLAKEKENIFIPTLATIFLYSLLIILILLIGYKEKMVLKISPKIFPKNFLTGGKKIARRTKTMIRTRQQKNRKNPPINFPIIAAPCSNAAKGVQKISPASLSQRRILSLTDKCPIFHLPPSRVIPTGQRSPIETFFEKRFQDFQKF
jgi:hypothetical protein